MGDTYNLILLPVIAGFLLMLLPERIKMIKGIIALLISAYVLVISILVFKNSGVQELTPAYLLSISGDSGIAGLIHKAGDLMVLHSDNLSRLIALIMCFFTFIILLYSIAYIKIRHKIFNYYAYFLLTLGFSIGAVFADNLLFFIFCWGFLGITLYKLIKGYDEESSASAKKTLILVGGSDSLMLLGIAIVWKINKSFLISDSGILTDSTLSIIAFLCLLIGSFTKAGAFPFHTWVPDYTKKAPATSSAYLPASLDKLLGIYFMYRLCVNMFILNQWLIFIIILIGVLTIIIAVMMALVQQNSKQLLGYHAVSQVGYMVLGLGLGNPIGIAGGLFHMFNHTLYKSGLFLVSGNIEIRTGTENLERMGGIAGRMPITFISAVVFALSISGVPPFNGFASKWLIYQGIIDFGNGTGIANQLWMLWLALAVTGSALTLASFIKFLSSAFLGRNRQFYSDMKETGFLMWLPVVILALCCIVIGIFATSYFIPKYIMPLNAAFEYSGIWNSSLIALLVIISIVLGLLFYLAISVKNMRTEDSFIGGEHDQEVRTVNVMEYYKTISNSGFFKWFYRKAEKKWFDLYDLLRNIIFWLNGIFSKCHTGVVPLYAIWILAGIIILLVLLF